MIGSIRILLFWLTFWKSEKVVDPNFTGGGYDGFDIEISEELEMNWWGERSFLFYFIASGQLAKPARGFFLLAVDQNDKTGYGSRESSVRGMSKINIIDSLIQL